MENALTKTGTVNVELTDYDMDLLKDIARDGQTNFIGLKREGLEIGQEYYSEVFCQITDMDRYAYKWEGGTNKLVDRNLSKEEAKAAGYAEGMDLTLKLLKPEFEETFTLSMPQSSYWNFSKYVAFLLSKNVHPKMVVTKIRTTLKQFKVGSPVAVATFEAVGMIQQQAEPVNVTPQQAPEPQAQAAPVETPPWEEPAPQPPKQAPVMEQPRQTEIPSEWA